MTRNTRLLDQRAGVVIDLSGLSIESADSSWCDEVGSEARKSEKKVSPVELRELKSITSRCLIGELVFNRRTLLELRSPASVTHGEVPIVPEHFVRMWAASHVRARPMDTR